MNIVSLDTETTGLSLRHGCRPFACVLHWPHKILWYEWGVNPRTRTPIIPPEDVTDIQERLSGQIVLTHNAKFDLLGMELIGVPIQEIVGWDNIHDTMLASHAYESGGGHGLKELCVRHLGLLDDDERRLEKACKSARIIAKKLKWDIAKPHHPHFPMVKKFGERNQAWKADMWLPRAVAMHQKRPATDPWYTVLEEYALLDGKRTLDLYLHLKNILEEEGLWDQYMKNQRLIRTTYEMERRGVSMRTSVVRAERMRFQKSARHYGSLAKKAIKRPGVNLRSGDQLVDLLYNEYKLPVLERTAKKKPSTSADTLAKLYPISPPEIQSLIENIIICRKFIKGLEYLELFAGHLIGDRVHCNIKITGTQVTRMAVNDPPMQTVGKLLGGKEYWPDEINQALKLAGVNLRRCFGPAPGREWYAIDYQQAHPRIFAWLSGDTEAQKVFNEGKDYYLHLASGALKTPIENISKSQRALFKMVNLADLYGVGDAKLEKNTGMPGLKQLLAETFPTRALFIGQIHDAAMGKGYVLTQGGYRLYCPDAHKLVNYTVIGCEGEVAKQALNQCSDYLAASQDADYDPYVPLQIHDELLFDFPVGDTERNLKHTWKCAQIMEQAAWDHQVNIPAEVTHIPEGASWFDGVKLHKE